MLGSGAWMKISDITKRFGKFCLDWQRCDSFETGIYGIIGSNGCGKTTLMKIMAGLVKPDSGIIDYEGLTPRDITMLFRKPYLMHDTVYSNLVYPLKLRGIKPDQRQVDFYLQMAGLEDAKKQYAPSLSGGQQQKLAFVRAMIFSPKLVLIDEALSNMDIESAAQFQKYILDAQKKSPAIWVIISHQLPAIRQLCDYVFFLHDGKPEAWGSAEEILLSPQSPNLQKYLQYQIIAKKT